MTQHTETNWRTSPSGDLIWANGQIIARCEAGGLTSQENQANARFIVKACNSFDAMYEALKEVVHDIMNDEGTCVKSDTQLKLFRALDQAEGK